MSDVIPFGLPGQRAASAQQPQPRAWPLPVRILFRFSFTYLALSSWFWMFEFSDKSRGFIAKPYQAITGPIARWTASHVYHWQGNIESSFVRDTRYLFGLLTSFLVASVIITAIWSILDRQRTEYRWLNHWMRVFLRYLLAYILLHYGMDKVFLLQFPAPSLMRLTERFGDYSPSSLMWAFIGSSTLFSVFGGVAELMGAVLLLSRRTTTLGALIGFAVMLNVTVMDFSYDVSVKIFCLHILLMAAYLFLPDAGRLFDFFVLNRATQAVALEPTKLSKAGHKVKALLKVAVVLFLLVPLMARDWQRYRTTGPGAAHPPLYGLYEVEEFTLAGVVHPSLTTDAVRWRYVAFEEPNVLSLKRMDESLSSYRMQYDAAQHSVTVSAPGDVADKSILQVSEESSGEITLQGNYGGIPVTAKLLRVDRGGFTLVNRGFHWINESSFIR